MNNNELYHYGVKGQKWGVVHNEKKGPRIVVNKTVNKTVNSYDHTRKYDRYLIKKDKKKQRASGDSVNIKKMTDKERLGYAKGRVKTMGSKAQAIRSETTNFAAKTAGTAAKSLLGTAVSAFAGASYASTLASGAAKVAMYATEGAILGGVGFGAVAVTSLSALTIKRGINYIKNTNAIKNVKNK